MKSFLLPAAALMISAACSTSQTETTANDSTALQLDTTELQFQNNDDTTDAPAPESVDGSLQGSLDENGAYVIEGTYGYVSDPFGFSLDVESLQEILGEKMFVKRTDTEGGEDEDGQRYEGYTYYEVSYGETELSFYSYTGKHHASIVTPLLVMKNDIRIGTRRADFLENMSINDSSALGAKSFLLNDDYGSLRFTFEADTVSLIRVFYEEGT
jgi:hypothetical protein